MKTNKLMKATSIAGLTAMAGTTGVGLTPIVAFAAENVETIENVEIVEQQTNVQEDFTKELDGLHKRLTDKYTETTKLLDATYGTLSDTDKNSLEEGFIEIKEAMSNVLEDTTTKMESLDTVNADVIANITLDITDFEEFQAVLIESFNSDIKALEVSEPEVEVVVDEVAPEKETSVEKEVIEVEKVDVVETPVVAEVTEPVDTVEIVDNSEDVPEVAVDSVDKPVVKVEVVEESIEQAPVDSVEVEKVVEPVIEKEIVEVKDVVEPVIEKEVVEVKEVKPEIKTMPAIAPKVQQATTLSALSKVSPQQFINNITAQAQSVAKDNGLYASVMIAQAALESGYGASSLSSAPNYNLFGMKGTYNGQSVNMNTLEDDGKGNYYPITAKFRKYPSYTQSLQDYANLLTGGVNWNKNIYAGAWVSNTNSYLDATKALTGVYATDTRYNTKLNNIIDAYNLTRFDTKQSNTGSVTKPDTNLPNTGATTYKVVSGDYLNKISAKFGITTADLMKWNNLTSTVIQVGQVLIVSEAKAPVVTPVAPKPEVKPDVKPEVKPVAPTNTAKYTVVSGDYLDKISAKFGITTANLMKWNNLKSTIIHVGQVLIVSEGTVTPTPTPEVKPVEPTKPVEKPEVKPTPQPKPEVKPVEPTKPVEKPVVKPVPTPTPTSDKVYTVVSGDYLNRIAHQNGTTTANIKSWNNLKSDIIHVGQKLIVGKGNTVTAPKPSTPTVVKPTPQAPT